jgi:hypothetical protein
MYNTITYYNNSATVSPDAVDALESAIRMAETLMKELRKSTQPETNVSRRAEPRFRKPPVTNRVATAEGKGDVLLTIQRDLHNIRKGIIDDRKRTEVLFRVDALIDNLENYMAEA